MLLLMQISVLDCLYSYSATNQQLFLLIYWDHPSSLHTPETYQELLQQLFTNQLFSVAWFSLNHAVSFSFFCILYCFDLSIAYQSKGSCDMTFKFFRKVDLLIMTWNFHLKIQGILFKNNSTHEPTM